MRIVIPSVGYADFLKTTLPAWHAMFPAAHVVVVTSPDDEATIDVVMATRGSGAVITTDVWSREGAVFNKARALDVGIGSVDGDDVCMVVDADVVPFGEPFKDDDIDSDTIYGCPRYFCPDPKALDDHRTGLLRREDLSLIVPRRPGQIAAGLAPHSDALAVACAVRCLGYCQVFRYRTTVKFGDSYTAAEYDYRFARAFERRSALSPSFYVLHLGEQDRRNWTGRVVAPWGAAPCAH